MAPSLYLRAAKWWVNPALSGASQDAEESSQNYGFMGVNGTLEYPFSPGSIMRGFDPKQPVIFSYVALEDRVPKDHPLRVIRGIVDRVLEDLSSDFSRMYAKRGRPSVPPEQLLRALLIQVLYTVRSERQLMEQLNYNLLFRWFVGLNADDVVWSATTFSKNRDRLLAGDVAVSSF